MGIDAFDGTLDVLLSLRLLVGFFLVKGTQPMEFGLGLDL